MDASITSQSKKARDKKKIVVFFLLLVAAYAAFSLTRGSGSGTGAREAGSAEQSSTITAAPERDADIYGMITSVRGNRITIMKFDPSMMPGAKKSAGAAEEGATEENAISLGNSSAMPQGGPSGRGMPSGGGVPSGMGGPGGFGEAAATTRETKLEELKKTSIGTETISVPVGIPITVQTTAAATMQTSTESGTLTDLNSDSVVAIWLEEEDGRSAETDAIESVAAYISVTGKVDMDNSTN